MPGTNLHGDDGVKVVELGDILLAVLGSMSEIPTNCFFVEFAGLEDVGQVFGDRAAPLVEKHPDELLRQPDRFIRHPDLDAVLARLPGKDQKLGGAVTNLERMVFFHGVFRWPSAAVIATWVQIVPQLKLSSGSPLLSFLAQGLDGAIIQFQFIMSRKILGWFQVKGPDQETSNIHDSFLPSDLREPYFIKLF